MPAVTGIDASIDDYDFDFDVNKLDLEDESDKKILRLRLEIIKEKLRLKTLQAAQALKMKPTDPLLKNHTKVKMPTNWDNDDDDVGGISRYLVGDDEDDDDEEEDDGFGINDFVRPTQAPPTPTRQPPIRPAQSQAKAAPTQSPARKATPQLQLTPPPTKLVPAPINMSPIQRYNSQRVIATVRQPSATSQPSRPASTRSTVDSRAVGGQQPQKTYSQMIADRRAEDEAQAKKTEMMAQLQRSRRTGFGLGKTTPSAADQPAGDQAETDQSSGAHFDPFTSLHLTKRHIPHTTLTRVLGSLTLLNLKQLLKLVKGPAFEPPQPPEIPSYDYVVVGVVASKSQPREHQNHGRAGGETNKFIVLTLSDLEHEVDLYLFGNAYTKYWKLIPGTVVAILNPGVMPPRGTGAPGKFALKLAGTVGAVGADNNDTPTDAVLEIGTARDLTWCEARKADGKECGTWVDRRKTTVCEFHLNMQIEKTRRGRMSMNTASGMNASSSAGGGYGSGYGGGYGSGRTSGPPSGRSSATTGGGGTSRSQTGGRHHDRNTGETLYFAPPSSTARPGARHTPTSSASSHRSASNHPDMDPFLGLVSDPSHLLRTSAENAKRKRAAAVAKERDLSRTLATAGSGVGRTYLEARAHGPDSSSSSTAAATATKPSSQQQADAEPRPLVTAESLGLVRDISTLSSPSSYKRRRAVGLGSTSSGSTSASTPRSGATAKTTTKNTSVPVGWSGANKRLATAASVTPAAVVGSSSPKKRSRPDDDDVDDGTSNRGYNSGKTGGQADPARQRRRIADAVSVSVPVTTTAAADESDSELEIV